MTFSDHIAQKSLRANDSSGRDLRYYRSDEGHSESQGATGKPVQEMLARGINRPRIDGTFVKGGSNLRGNELD